MKAKVLVIEDNDAVRRTVCSILRAGGYETAEAETGKEGMTKLGRGDIALVITDIVMPDQDGIETIQRIRELDATLPIIAMSGSGTEDYSPLHDAKLMGADRIIGKPFQVEEILWAVRELLRGQGS
jgi:DNA-binding response OmpR family regulator